MDIKQVTPLENSTIVGQEYSESKEPYTMLKLFYSIKNKIDELIVYINSFFTTYLEEEITKNVSNFYTECEYDNINEMIIVLLKENI